MPKAATNQEQIAKNTTKKPLLGCVNCLGLNIIDKTYGWKSKVQFNNIAMPFMLFSFSLL